MMWTATRETEDNTYEIKIEHDEYYQHTDDELGTIVGSYGRYNFFTQAKNTDDYTSWDEWRKGELPKDVIACPVYMYVHSGIVLSTEPFSCPWDSGQLGFIYATRKQVREWYGVKRVTKKVEERAYQYFDAQIEMMNAILAGEVYQFSLYENGNEVESSCGFIKAKGDKDFFKDMAEYWGAPFKDMIDELEESY